ncbi:MAG: cytochrome-c peroxidase [Acidobacteria bacterium]|nr:cytochrome-c peroxidase [Acidobacteriota bacterium]
MMARPALLLAVWLGVTAAIVSGDPLPQTPAAFPGARGAKASSSTDASEKQTAGPRSSHNRPAFWIPSGLDDYVPVPLDNQATAAKVDLGARLFFDPILSADGETSCATCHLPDLAFTDGRPLAVGVYGRVGRRNVPTILNRGYGKSFFWDGRVASLEAQARDAIEGREDLGLPIEDAVVRLREEASYRAEFRNAFDPGAGDGFRSEGNAAHDADTRGPSITAQRVTQALATFVRSQMAGDSFRDRYRSGDWTAMSAAALRGLDVFALRGRCLGCHLGPLSTDEKFHNTGVSWGADPGRQKITGYESDRGRFKTPSLRNVALTAPYMHDGSIATLEEAVEFYDQGGNPNPNLDPFIAPLHLTDRQKADLVAFLEALTSVDLAGGR